MHLKNSEFVRQLSTKFKDHQKYKEAIRQIRMRPELAPHYILNVKSNYELGPGTQRDSKTSNQRETLEIIAKIDFK